VSIRIVLAEDHFLLREGLRRLLEAEADLEVVAVCDNFDGLLDAVAGEQPDVVVTDIRMPPTNLDEGIRAAEHFRATKPDLGVVVLSQYVEPGYAHALFEGGTERRAYLLKDRVSEMEQLAGAIRSVVAGGSAVDPKVVEGLVGAKASTEYSPLQELTPRELDVLRGMAEGKNNASIAASLFLTERSVEKVIHSIFRKLDLGWDASVHKRVKAVILYLADPEMGTEALRRSPDTVT
jgi:DNA-binding NarL/FixJ family response regulator